MMPSCEMLNDFRNPAELPTPAGLAGRPWVLVEVGAANEVSAPTCASARLIVTAWFCAALDTVVEPGMSQALAPVLNAMLVTPPVNWPLASNVSVAPVVGVSVGPPFRSGEVTDTFHDLVLPVTACGVNVSTTVCC